MVKCREINSSSILFFFIIQVSIEGKLAPQSRTAIVEPNETLIEQNGVLVARALVDVTNAKVPVKLCNLQEEELVI